MTVYGDIHQQVCVDMTCIESSSCMYDITKSTHQHHTLVICIVVHKCIVPSCFIHNSDALGWCRWLTGRWLLGWCGCCSGLGCCSCHGRFLDDLWLCHRHGLWLLFWLTPAFPQTLLCLVHLSLCISLLAACLVKLCLCSWNKVGDVSITSAITVGDHKQNHPLYTYQGRKYVVWPP